MEMMNYPLTVYQDFEKAVGGSQKAFEKLLNDGYPQWAALSNAIQGDREAVLWLLRNGYSVTGVLANALLEEEGAIAWLERYPEPFYHVFYMACQGNRQAVAWLEERNLIAFIILAKAIRKAVRLRIKRNTFWYKIDW